jgi:hypothetical protein
MEDECLAEYISFGLLFMERTKSVLIFNCIFFCLSSYLLGYYAF